MPADAQGEVKQAFWAAFDTDELLDPARPGGPLAAGLELQAAVQARLGALAAAWQPSYPSAAKCLLTDRQALTTYLRFPVEHHRRVRHSNFIERTFGETRRRVKVIGRLPGEASCLGLVFAVLDRASRGWRGLTMTPAGLRQLHDLRRQLLDPPTALRLDSSTPTVAPETVGVVA